MVYMELTWMNQPDKLKKAQQKAKRLATIGTVLYLLFFPVFLYFVRFSFFIFDSPSITQTVGFIFVFTWLIFPFTLPVSVYFMWSSYIDQNYKKTQFFFAFPFYVFFICILISELSKEIGKL